MCSPNKFQKAMRQAKAIKHRKNKRKAVLTWCRLMQEALEA